MELKRIYRRWHRKLKIWATGEVGDPKDRAKAQSQYLSEEVWCTDFQKQKMESRGKRQFLDR